MNQNIMRPRALPPIPYPACMRTREAFAAAVDLGPGLVCLVGGSGSGKTYILKLFELTVRGRRVGYRRPDAAMAAAIDVDMVDDVSSQSAERLSSDDLSGLVRVLSLDPSLLEEVLRLQPSARVVRVRAMDNFDVELMVNERCNHLGIERKRLPNEAIAAFMQAGDATPRQLDRIIGGALRGMLDEGAAHIDVIRVDQDTIAQITPNTLNIFPARIGIVKNPSSVGVRNAGKMLAAGKNGGDCSSNLIGKNLGSAGFTPITRNIFEHNKTSDANNGVLSRRNSLASGLQRRVTKAGIITVPAAGFLLAILAVLNAPGHQWPFSHSLPSASQFQRHDEVASLPLSHEPQTSLPPAAPTTALGFDLASRNEIDEQFQSSDPIQLFVSQEHSDRIAKLPSLPPKAMSNSHTAALETPPDFMDIQGILKAQANAAKSDHLVQIARVMDAIGQKEDAQDILHASASMGSSEAERLLSQ